ncbi:hypothetical protein SDC9_102182 [bioreactor metagenome]|uniref:DUF975 family protein n=1 Tax=bioreactor metagenome TaxID=1076179 RepID=A0A645AR46_9ZZZZ
MNIRSVVKRDVKFSLSGNWLAAILASIGMSILVSLGMSVFRTGNAVSLVAFLAIAPINMGIITWYLALLRKQDHNGNLFFSWVSKEKYFPSIKSYGFFWLLRMVQFIISSIVLLIMGVIGMFTSLPMMRGRGFIMPHIFGYYNGYRDFNIPPAAALYILLAILIFFAVYICIEIFIIRYSAIYNLLNDNPQILLSEAIGQSKDIMRGHTGEMILFYLSFIGWYLLVPITFGLILLYLVPYFTASRLLYIEYLRDLHRNKERMHETDGPIYGE